MSKISKTFGHVLQRYRKEAGLSQMDLALKASLGRTFISALERGVRQPSITTLFKLCRVLAVPPHRFILEVERSLSFYDETPNLNNFE